MTRWPLSSITITGAYQPGKMRASSSFNSVRRKAASLSRHHCTLSVAMRLLSAAALVVLVCSERSASATRLRCLNSSCSTSPVCCALNSSINALIWRSSSFCGSAKAASVAFVIRILRSFWLRRSQYRSKNSRMLSVAAYWRLKRR
jgi:hypothetical protein